MYLTHILHSTYIPHTTYLLFQSTPWFPVRQRASKHKFPPPKYKPPARTIEWRLHQSYSPIPAHADDRPDDVGFRARTQEWPCLLACILSCTCDRGRTIPRRAVNEVTARYGFIFRKTRSQVCFLFLFFVLFLFIFIYFLWAEGWGLYMCNRGGDVD